MDTIFTVDGFNKR